MFDDNFGWFKAGPLINRSEDEKAAHAELLRAQAKSLNENTNKMKYLRWLQGGLVGLVIG